MNKEKVMQAVYEVADLQSICDKDIREKAINKVQKELESKPVMPKVFDDWYKNDSTYGDPNTLKFKIIHFTVMTMWGGKGIESQERLCDWIKKAHKDKYTYDEERFVRCIEAILYGYEVEK